MVYRAAVIALLGSLLVLHIGSEVRSAHHSALTASLTAAMVKQPSAAPTVVVQRDARSVRLPADTMVVDVRASELARLIANAERADTTNSAGNADNADNADSADSADTTTDKTTDSQPRPARLVPLVRSGEHVGYKVYAIVDGSLMSTLGFENGDTLLAVNDQPVTDFNHSSELLSLIESSPFSDFKIRREGQTQRIVVLAHN